VNIEVFQDRLQLARSWQGKRFRLYIGLPDTIANRKAAEIKVPTISHLAPFSRTGFRACSTKSEFSRFTGQKACS
jgi:hypothetical protein